MLFGDFKYLRKFSSKQWKENSWTVDVFFRDRWLAISKQGHWPFEQKTIGQFYDGIFRLSKVRDIVCHLVSFDSRENVCESPLPEPYSSILFFLQIRWPQSQIVCLIASIAKVGSDRVRGNFKQSWTASWHWNTNSNGDSRTSFLQ